MLEVEEYNLAPYRVLPALGGIPGNQSMHYGKNLPTKQMIHKKAMNLSWHAQGGKFSFSSVARDGPWKILRAALRAGLVASRSGLMATVPDLLLFVSRCYKSAQKPCFNQAPFLNLTINMP